MDHCGTFCSQGIDNLSPKYDTGIVRLVLQPGQKTNFICRFINHLWPSYAQLRLCCETKNLVLTHL
jgi:hypothetical protein